MRIKEELLNLKKVDIYSLLLFVLFQIKQIPEYSSLTELVYLLDKDSVLKLCQYFGGTTLQIPTLEELEVIVYSVLLYNYVDIDNKDMDEALKLIGCSKDKLKEVKRNYIKISKLLERYTFNRSDKNE